MEPHIVDSTGAGISPAPVVGISSQDIDLESDMSELEANEQILNTKQYMMQQN